MFWVHGTSVSNSLHALTPAKLKLDGLFSKVWSVFGYRLYYGT